MKPLKGLKVIDFTTLLPGPLATLMLSEAGAEVFKIEKIGGEDARNLGPFLGSESLPFGMLNRGKKSIEIDLKSPSSHKKIIELIKEADVLVEQFRPGVMKRLKLDWNSLKKVNSRLIYCSISGYGQTGPKRNIAGHDINYMSQIGLLSLSTDLDGRPTIPASQYADIAGGSYPAFMNILLAIISRQKTKKGCFLDIAMYENLIPLAWLGITHGLYYGTFPKSSDLHLNGKLARYNIYKTKDKRYLALGALENKFWKNFCKTINASNEILEEKISQKRIIKKIESIISQRSGDYWKKLFHAEENVCCSLIEDIENVFDDVHLKQRKIFSGRLSINKKQTPFIPTVIDKTIKKIKMQSAPLLGKHNSILKKK